jgi:hypothetical protein
MTKQNLKHIATIPMVPQYNSSADVFIQEDHPSGQRLLVVMYEKGGYDGRPKYTSAIPNGWTEQDVLDFIFWPTKTDAPFPAWEMPARVYGRSTLFRWWEA